MINVLIHIYLISDSQFIVSENFTLVSMTNILRTLFYFVFFRFVLKNLLFQLMYLLQYN